MNPTAALFLGLQNFTASRLPILAYFVPGAVVAVNSKPLLIPEKPDPIPADWKEIALVETSVSDAENFTGLLANNPEVLTGEIPSERAFIVRQFYFTTKPTIDDRLILRATGENFAITNVDSLAEIGDVPNVYRFICRAL